MHLSLLAYLKKHFLFFVEKFEKLMFLCKNQKSIKSDVLRDTLNKKLRLSTVFSSIILAAN